MRKLSVEELPQLCAELRQCIIGTLATHPGHLASGLGVVELTVALHYVFNTPDDKLVWDVGHQSYAHKILTGRRNSFQTIRTYGGISGFPRRDESEYDAFGTGHSSTSISAALGMATASKLQGNSVRQHIAVIGDGSMTGGEAFEALNNAGVSKSNILVVLNDNGISIDKAVGGLSRYLVRVIASRRYNRFKERVWRRMGGDSVEDKRKEGKKVVRRMSRFTKTVKAALMGGTNLFESLGFRYFGPIDGHDVEMLVSVLEQLKEINGPKLLHIVTKKGKGLRMAERNPVVYHAPGKFDVETGKQIASSSLESQPPKYQDVFGHTIIELAEQNNAIVGITPAMPTGCSLNMMMERMPSRTFDVGIAEQHAVTFSAGLAAQGLLPFCNIYSSFMQRAYDQVIHDVALQHLNVVMCLDRAGLVGEDGATHHGVFDLSYLRPIPGLTICAPMNEHELRNMMFTAQLPNQGPVVIRYPRGKGVMVDWRNEMQPIEVGKGRCVREGTDVAILSLGHIGNNAVKAAESVEDLSVAVYDMRYLKPLDTQLLDEVIQRGFKKIITIEDGSVMGGLGSAVLEYFASVGATVPVTLLGVPDHFVPHGSVAQLQHDCGIDVEGIISEIRAVHKNC